MFDIVVSIEGGARGDVSVRRKSAHIFISKKYAYSLINRVI